MKNELKFKNFQIKEFKEDDGGNLTITGYGAVFGNIDSYGDIIEKGAFAKTLSDRKGRIAFCYQHDIYNPIGKILEAKEDDNGLWMEVMLSKADQDIITKVKEGILSEMSIGYRTIESKSEVRDGQDIELLTEIKLFEVSLVTIAANPLALVTGMKAEEKRDKINSEFDRVIALTRSDNLKFEIMMLKALVCNEPLKVDESKDTQKQDEPLTSKEALEILKSI
jgi:HK97 family phage prohead protease